jgi:hypothetical protein
MAPEMSRDPLTDAYLNYARAARPVSDEHLEVSEAVDSLLTDDPERLWRILCESLAQAESDAVLARIAAGALEDLIVKRGPEFIDRIEAQAEQDSRFRRALVGVWGRNRMDRDVAERLDRLIADESPL